MIDAVPAIVNVKDRDLRYVMMNRYAASVLGVTPEDGVGATTVELMRRYDATKSDEFDRQVRDTGEELGFYEDQYVDASGTLRYWLTKKVPLLDPGGKVGSIVSVALDIGERKRAEQTLQAAKDSAEAASRAKSEFLAMGSAAPWPPPSPPRLSASPLSPLPPLCCGATRHPTSCRIYPSSIRPVACCCSPR